MLVKVLVKVQPVACIKFARKVALLVLKLGRDVEEDIAVFLGILLEQLVVVVDVFVGQVRHLLVLPAGHRQNRLDDDAAVGGNTGQLVNQQVVLLVVSVGELSCRVTTTGDSVFCQLAPCWWIDWIADLLPAGGCRFDLEL